MVDRDAEPAFQRQILRQPGVSARAGRLEGTMPPGRRRQATVGPVPWSVDVDVFGPDEVPCVR